MGELTEAVKKYGSAAAAARALDIPSTTFTRHLEKEREGTSVKTTVRKAEPKKTPHQGLTEEELLLKYSPEHKIVAAAKAIPEGTFILEADFIRGLQITGGYKHIVEREQFQAYRGRAPGSVWYWAHPKRMAAMKADGVLR